MNARQNRNWRQDEAKSRLADAHVKRDEESRNRVQASRWSRPPDSEIGLTTIANLWHNQL